MIWVAGVAESLWHATGAAPMVTACGHVLTGPVHGRRSTMPPEDGHRSSCLACLQSVDHAPISTPWPRRPTDWPRTDPDAATKRRRALSEALDTHPPEADQPSGRKEVLTYGRVPHVWWQGRSRWRVVRSVSQCQRSR